MPESQELYERYVQKMQRIADVRNANNVLQWDQETYLPVKGNALRGQQISTLSEIAHQLFSEESTGKLLQELLTKNDLTLEEKRNVALSWEDYEKSKKYSSQFVRKLSAQVNKTYYAWIEAREKNSFSVYEKDLKALIELKKEETHLLGFQQHPYDALLNEHEKGSSVSLIDKTFKEVLPTLKNLLNRIESKPQVDDSFLKQHFPKQQQWMWGLHLLQDLHFDMESGRQDLSTHPFSVSFNCHDVRITTRIDENDFGNMTWSCIHEVGHALYEQGLPENQYGLPLGEACSYSIHESQSRLWENNVGRSKSYWKNKLPQLKTFFPDQFKDVDLEHFYKGINKVTPSLIRTEADEITYHFHVFIRYELEKMLIDGSIGTADIPHFWNEQYQKWMHLTVPDDKNGCLQDVHWSHGSFGYFPTYSLGSFYAAQFFNAAKLDLPSVASGIASGNNLPLLEWLRTNIHGKGRFYNSEDLCKAATGEPLHISIFTAYLLEKYKAIYNL